MIAKIIELLQMNEYFGAGKFTEIAKGKNEMALNFKDFKNKLKRQWQ